MKSIVDLGNFTNEQKKLAREIATRIKKLRQSGCVVIGKQDYLIAYLKEEYENSSESMSPYQTPTLECGKINDSGADDGLYLDEEFVIPF